MARAILLMLGSLLGRAEAVQDTPALHTRLSSVEVTAHGIMATTKVRGQKESRTASPSIGNADHHPPAAFGEKAEAAFGEKVEEYKVDGENGEELEYKFLRGWNWKTKKHEAERLPVEHEPGY